MFYKTQLAMHKPVKNQFRLKPLVRCMRLVITSGVFASLVAPVRAELPIPGVAGVGLAPAWVASPGIADLSSNGTTMIINQHAPKAILNWQKFNVGKDNTVQFKQPDASSIALNRIFQENPSQILGHITANGQIYLVNNNGFVFGKDSVVDANTLVASALNISDDTYQKGIIRVFDQNKGVMDLNKIELNRAAFNGNINNDGTPVDPNAKIEVDSGAKIHAGQNGNVMLVAPTVSNAGSISTDQQGQILMVASQDKVYLQPTSGNDAFAGLLVEVGKGGTVTNEASGNIAVRQGNITLAGFAVNQMGRLNATTSVSVNGSVRLLARENPGTIPEITNKGISYLGPTQSTQTIRNGGTVNEQESTVTMGPNSSVTVLADANGGTAIDEQAQNQSFVEVSAAKIDMKSGSSIVATGGIINLTATALDPLIDLANPLHKLITKTKANINLESGSLIDVSGSQNVQVAMSRNVVNISVQSFNLRDAPYQRGGVLQGQTVQVDIRNLPSIVDASSATASIQRGINERLGLGGIINLTSSGDVVVNSGAVVNISGGTVSYQDGYINTTKLLSTTGRIVDIGKADPNEQYASIYGIVTENHAKWGITNTWNILDQLGMGRFEKGYTEGKAGGALNIVSSVTDWSGQLVAGTISSIYQNSQPLSGGTFTINQADSGSQFLSTQNVVFTDQPLILDPLAKKNQASNLVLSTALVNQSGISNLTIKTGGSFTLASDAALSMPALSSFTVNASNIDIKGSLYAPGGTINLKSIDLSTIDAHGKSNTGYSNLENSSVLDVSGRWINDFQSGVTSALATPAEINAGTVSVTANNDLSFKQGAMIKADGGAWLGLTGTNLKNGNGGTIKLSAGPGAINPGVLHVDGGLSAYGLSQGGTLSLTSNKIVVGTTPTSGDQLLNLGVTNGKLDVAANAGFSTINLTSNVENITVKANTDLALLSQNRMLNANYRNQANSSSIAGFSQVTTLPDSVRKAVTLSLTGQAGSTDAAALSALLVQYTTVLAGRPISVDDAATLAVMRKAGNYDATTLTAILLKDTTAQARTIDAANLAASLFKQQAGVLLETGSRIHVDNASTVNLTAENTGKGIYINGLIDAPAGNINLTLKADVPLVSYDGSLAIWLGSNASLNTKGTTLFNLVDALGRISGNVLNGGNITVQTDRGYVVIEKGAALDVSGTTTSLDLPVSNAGGLGQQFTRQVIGSNAGKISISAAEGIVLDGLLTAKAGSSTNQGGSLNLTLDRNQRKEPSFDKTFKFDQALQFNVVQDSQVMLPSKAEFGLIPDNVNGIGINGQATVSSSQITQAGFDQLRLAVPLQKGDPNPIQLMLPVPGVIKFNGDVNLMTTSSLILDSQIISWSGISGALTGAVNLNSAYLQLGSSTYNNVLGTSSSVGATLTTNAIWTQLDGALLITGYKEINLKSAHDLRAVGIQVIEPVPTGSNSQAKTQNVASNRILTGSLSTAANLNLTASQIYPTTLTNYTFAVTNPAGKLTISGSNTDATPLSAAGQLTLNAATINQNGVLKAPLGTIKLIASAGLNFGSGSVTTVSANGNTIPFGLITNNVWEYPLAGNINLVFNQSLLNPDTNVYDYLTLGEKHLIFQSSAIQFNAGSSVDVSGGGNLLATQFQPGLGGSNDYLLRGNPSYQGGFAILPSLGSSLAPFDPNLSAGFGYSAGVNIYLNGTGGLSAGMFAILPAYYALLPGAYLITPQGIKTQDQIQTSFSTVGLPIVSGYQTMVGTNVRDSRTNGYLIETSAQVQKHSTYNIQNANSFFSQQAVSTNTAAPLLPQDAGQISIDASTKLVLDGQFNVSAPNGKGAKMDISSTNIEVVNNLSATTMPGILQISAQSLSQLHVDSLFLGGTRSSDRLTGNTNLTVTATNVTFDQGIQLQSLDLIAAAKNKVEVMSGATITSSGKVNTGDRVLNLLSREIIIKNTDKLPGDVVSPDKMFVLRDFIVKNTEMLTGDVVNTKNEVVVLRDNKEIIVKNTDKLPGDVVNTNEVVVSREIIVKQADELRSPPGHSDVFTSDTEVVLRGGVNIIIKKADKLPGDVISPDKMVVLRDNVATIVKQVDELQSPLGQSDVFSPNKEVILTSDAALLRVSSDKQVTVNRPNFRGVDGNVSIATGSKLAASKSMLLDGSSSTVLNGGIVMLGGALTLTANTINFGEITGVHANDLNLSLQKLPSLAVDDLILNSRGSINFYGNVNQLDSNGKVTPIHFNNLLLDAAALSGFDNVGKIASLQANNLVLQHSRGVAAALAGTGLGTLNLSAGQYSQSGTLNMDGFSAVNINVDKQLTANGNSLMTLASDLNVTAGLLTTTGGHSLAFNAGGHNVVINGNAEASVYSSSDFGGSLAITANAIKLNSANLLLPSGSLTLLAQTGDILVNGKTNINLAGQAVNFAGTLDYTPGGTFSATASLGKVMLALAADSKLDISTGGGSAAGGNLILKAPNSTVELAGNLKATGASANLDVSGFAAQSFDSLMTKLNAAGVTNSVYVRSRNADIIQAAIFQGVPNVLTANTLTLVADKGAIDISGTLNADGLSGGTINLDAGGKITLENGALISAKGTNIGGKVSLSSIDSLVNGYSGIELKTGSTIDVGGGGTGNGGDVILRTLRSPDGINILTDNAGKIAGTVTGAKNYYAEGVQVYTNSNFHWYIPGQINASDIATINSDTANYMSAANMTKVANLERGIRLRPGIEIDYKGDLALAKYVLNSSGNQILSPKLDAYGSYVYATDAYGNPVYATDASGNPVLDLNGNQVPGLVLEQVQNVWDFSALRYGSLADIAGSLIINASGKLDLNGSITDGYNLAPKDDLANPGTNIQQGVLDSSISIIDPNTGLAVSNTGLIDPSTSTARLFVGPLQNGNSWSFQLVAGADQTSADKFSTLDLTSAEKTANSIAKDLTIGTGVNIHTGSGDIKLASGGNLVLTDQTSTIYNAGRQDVTNPYGTLDGQTGTGSLAGITLVPLINQDTNAAGEYPIAGGNLVIRAGANITGTQYGATVTGTISDNILTISHVNPGFLLEIGQTIQALDNKGNLVKDTITGFETGTGGVGSYLLAGSLFLSKPTAISVSGNQFINSWLLRQGTAKSSLPAWAVDSTQFQQNIGSFGGGKVDIAAAGNINDLSVMMPTTGKQLGTDFSINNVQVLGGGTMTVTAGGDISGGAYFLGKGQGAITADGQIKGSNSTDPNAFFTAGPQIVMSGDQKPFNDSNPDSNLSLNAGKGIRISAVSDAMVLNAVGAGTGTEFFTYTDKSKLALKSLTGDIHLNSDTKAVVQKILNITNQFEQQLSTVYPASVDVTAFGGTIKLDSTIILFPSAISNLNMLAKQDITSGTELNSIIMSDADPKLLPSAYLTINRNNDQKLLTTANIFDITNNISNSIHALSPIHSLDTQPAKIITQTGDISLVQVILPKQNIIQAGHDLKNSPLQLQNINQTDASIISAGRDIVFATSLDINGNPSNNSLNQIAISGPGNALVKTGRNLDLGLSSGLTTIGNMLNPALPLAGANLDILVGLNAGTPSYNAFIDKYLLTNPLYTMQLTQVETLITGFIQQHSGNLTLSQSDAMKAFGTLTGDQTLPIQPQLNAILNGVFFNELKIAGSASATNKSAGNKGGFTAVDTLFPGNQWQGDLTVFFSKIQTLNGGDINLMVPGGQVNAGLAVAPSGAGAKTAGDLGIVAQRAGNINAFVNNDFTVNTSRVFTLGGGDILIWSSEGNIDAGKGAKSALAVTIDPPYYDSNDKLVYPAPKITSGSGIRTAGSLGIPAGNVFLFAPKGVVDAGEAGIGGTNVTISATAVLGANNIQVTGTSTGVPVASVGSVAAGLTGTTNSTTNTSQTAQAALGDDEKGKAATQNLALGLLSVELLGFGE